MVPGATLGERPAPPGPWFSGVIRAARNCYSTRPARRTGWPDERAPASASMLRTTNPASTREREYGRRRAVVSNPTGATPSGRPILTWTPTAATRATRTGCTTLTPTWRRR